MSGERRQAEFTTSIPERLESREFYASRPSHGDCVVFEAKEECVYIANRVLQGRITSQEVLKGLEIVIRYLDDQMQRPWLNCDFSPYPKELFYPKGHESK